MGEHIYVIIRLHRLLEPLAGRIGKSVITTVVGVEKYTSDAKAVKVLVIVCSTHRGLVKHHIQSMPHVDTMQRRMRVCTRVSVVVMITDTRIERSLNSLELVIQMLYQLLCPILRQIAMNYITHAYK